jgi:membrane-associated phospholipid phosphatase
LPALPGTLASLDLALFRFVRGTLHRPALTPPVRAFTHAGEHAFCWYLVGLLGAVVDSRRSRQWVRAMLLVLATELLNTALKLVVRRERPAVDGLEALIEAPRSKSFPSAHASTSFAAAGRYARLVPALSAPLHAAAAAMAASRVWLGVHYPFDVLAGAALGTAVARA